MKRYIVAILYVSLAFQARSAAAADIVPGTSDALPQLVTPRGTYKLGKKPYPAGTRSQWIAEGRVLARAPEGYYLPR